MSDFDGQEYIRKNYPETEHDRYAGPTRAWKCDNCGRIVERWRGMDDVQCECGAWYNSFGQRLRDDWMDNPSNWTYDYGDMEGFEISQLRKEHP